MNIVTGMIKLAILSIEYMKRAKQNLKDYTIFMRGRKRKLKYTASGHVPTRPWVLLKNHKVSYLLFVKVIANKSRQEEVNIVPKLH